MTTELIPIEDVNAIELFTNGGIDPLLERIDKEISAFVPDLKTATGRKEIASIARKVASSKVVIDKAGKELVSGWKAQAKAVDAERKKAEAKERAEREKEEAIERERRRAEEKAAAEKRAEAARAADRENRRTVNNKIVSAFRAEGIGEKTAQSVVRLVASGSIPHIKIDY